MKNLILVLVLMMGISGYSYSQDQQPLNSNAPAKVKEPKSPEERAQRFSNKMGKDLVLTQDQIKKVYENMLNKVKITEEIRAKFSEDKKAMHEKMKELNAKFEEQLKAILTAEQFTRYLQMEQEKEQRKAERKNGDR